MIVTPSYEGLVVVHAANPEVKLGVGHDPELPGELALFVEYPKPSGDPAGRDVWCDVEKRDWTAGRAILFSVKPAHAVRLSLSFLDRNRVAYTAWMDLVGGAWQPVRIAFDQIQPNPYFQLPGVKTGMPIDVSEIRRIGFAPHDETSGSLSISSFLIGE